MRRKIIVPLNVYVNNCCFIKSIAKIQSQVYCIPPPPIAGQKQTNKQNNNSIYKWIIH